MTWILRPQKEMSVSLGKRFQSIPAIDEGDNYIALAWRDIGIGDNPITVVDSASLHRIPPYLQSKETMADRTS
ncbi:MAG: hypothetical protein A4E60_03122 [Syntrophorhabdus sp. PtaB.Bin047]|nr:MAG: hypothetical protein A4E60_03122 [Syntrophorhabdus sp. PtaB.Bin047]